MFLEFDLMHQIRTSGYGQVSTQAANTARGAFLLIRLYSIVSSVCSLTGTEWQDLNCKAPGHSEFSCGWTRHHASKCFGTGSGEDRSTDHFSTYHGIKL
ncbi:hypothetical protein EAE99_006738 [Botrytis elliptica]|nr:hypothetical protein EAE99_006738 [Botrytis elliptica]